MVNFTRGSEFGRSESAEQQKSEQFRRADALLNPTSKTSRVIYRNILENGQPIERTAEQWGYNAGDLEKRGEGIEKQLQAYHQEDKKRGGNNFSTLSEEDRVHAEFLQGLWCSGGDENSGDGTPSDTHEFHSRTKMGLAYELVRQMRKIVTALDDPNPHEIPTIIGGKEDLMKGFALVPSEVIERDVDPNRIGAVKVRKKEIISSIVGSRKKLQYSAAMAILDKELYAA